MNGSKYDWPFVVERATQKKILDWIFIRMTGNPCQNITIDSILRWNYCRGIGEPFYKDFLKRIRKGKKITIIKKTKNREGISIKITPEENFTSTFLKIPGCVPIDVIVAFKKLHLILRNIRFSIGLDQS